LFVQTAKAMALDADENRLTLRGVSPVTLFFSDRPERIAGNMSTELSFRSGGRAPTASSPIPPNADLSILEDTAPDRRRAPEPGARRRGSPLHVDGAMPVLGDAVSVFIDVIGMPLTPVACAGVARRAYRRAVPY
jgi:hypothetical protein